MSDSIRNTSLFLCCACIFPWNDMIRDDWYLGEYSLSASSFLLISTMFVENTSKMLEIIRNPRDADESIFLYAVCAFLQFLNLASTLIETDNLFLFFRYFTPFFILYVMAPTATKWNFIVFLVGINILFRTIQLLHYQ